MNDNYDFTDEFVNWVESQRTNGQQVNYLLDNEPSLWAETHPRLYGTTGATFADIGQRSIETASVIKDLNPDAKVLGGVTFGWTGAQSLQNAPDFNEQVPPAGRDPRALHFNRWLLETTEDLDFWQSEFGDTLSGSDFLNWQRDFEAANLQAAAVPEPTTLAGLLLGLAFAVNCRRLLGLQKVAA